MFAKHGFASVFKKWKKKQILDEKSHNAEKCKMDPLGFLKSNLWQSIFKNWRGTNSTHREGLKVTKSTHLVGIFQNQHWFHAFVSVRYPLWMWFKYRWGSIASRNTTLMVVPIFFEFFVSDNQDRMKEYFVSREVVFILYQDFISFLGSFILPVF